MENLLRKIYQMPKLYKALIIISKLIVLVTLPAFILLVWHNYTASPICAITVCVICGMPFAVVTLLRRMIDLPRPYEIYDFYEVAPKNKKGKSFPSRHAFSIFIIATVMLLSYPAVAALLFALGVLLSVCRVLTGIHFVRDVVTGALLCVISGGLGILSIALFL